MLSGYNTYNRHYSYGRRVHVTMYLIIIPEREGGIHTVLIEGVTVYNSSSKETVG